MATDNKVLFTSGKYKSHAAFWRAKLSAVDQEFAFRAGNHPDRDANRKRGKRAFYLDKQASEIINDLTKGQGLGSFVILLSAFYIAISKYSDSRSVSVKTPLLRQNELPVRYTNEVILAEEIDTSLTIRKFIGNVKNTVAHSYKYQNFPLDIVFDPSQLNRTSTNVLIFAPQLHYKPEDIDLYDLAVEVVKDGFATRVDFTYNTEFFDGLFIQSFARVVQNVLGAYADLDCPLSRISFLSRPDRENLLLGFNKTQRDYPRKLVHELFEAQVERTPERIAVCTEQSELTYSQLNGQANQVANYLREEIGVARDDLVGIMVNRSVRMVSALLGILKSGAAYVPIDPEYPKDRIQHMLLDAKMKALVIDSEFLPGVEAFQGKLCVVDKAPGELDRPQVNLENINALDDLAYSIYTSGSTGKPKGVQIPHRAVVNFLHSMRGTPGLSERDVLMAVTPLSFDIAGLEVFLPLTVGAKVVIASRADASDGSQLSDRLNASGATVMQATPATWRMLVEFGWRGNKKLRALCGGELLPSKLASQLSSKTASLWNMYGPTETTIWSALTRVRKGESRITVGGPIANTEIYLLDADLEPVPIGVAGELYIGGEGLARGYLNLPDLTAEKFIPDPFSARSGARIYRAGDSARYLPDGRIEILGRVDYQVKVRGYRIELGEIETVLDKHAGVKQVVMLAREDQPGDTRLVCYCVPDTVNTPTASELRSFAQEKLPEYMVPSAFVMLSSMPLTPNGKVDRRAFPAPDWARAETHGSFAAPHSVVETSLASIWSRVLGIEQIGIDDSFFALGGDSMRGIRVAALGREAGINFTLQHIFQSQTIRQLAVAIGGVEEESNALAVAQPFGQIFESDYSKLPESIEDAYPLTMLQAGMMFQSEFNLDTAMYHQIISFHLKAPFDEPALYSAGRELMDRHPVLRTSFHMSGFSEPLQLVHKTVATPIEIDDLRELPAAEQDLVIAGWIEAKRQKRFDWENAPLLSIQIHRRTDETLQFSVSIPHALLDGWSDGIFLTELFTRYISLIKGEPQKSQPPLASSFRDYVAAEREALASEETRTFWTKKLRDSIAMRLPRLSAPKSGDTSPQFNAVSVPIQAQVSDGLERLARLASVPIKSVLMAAHLRVISFLSGQSDVITGTVSNARLEQNDGDRVIGLFLNTLPFRLKLDGGTWNELARETFEAEKESLPHRRYPMAQIQATQGGSRLFETGFNFTHFHVYDGLREFSDIEVLDGTGVMETDFVLMAAFDQDLNSNRINLSLHCDARELSPRQIEAIQHYYSSALTEMSNNPLGRYDQADLLSAAEKEQLFEESNDTTREYERDKNISQMIEHQAAVCPEATAVECGQERLTYGELNRRANRLGHYLRKRGVGAEQRVGICMERGIEMVVGMLGILKAGGAYVPMDPVYPRQRLAYMAEDAQISLLVTQGSPLDQMSEHTAEVVCLDRDKEEIGAESDRNFDGGVTAENLAYVIYTSGSTGVPKGVQIQHGSLMNLVCWHVDQYRVSSKDRATQLASIGFDAAVWEIWPYLVAGASVCVIDDETRATPEKLRDWLVENEVTMSFQATPLAERFIEEEWPKEGKLRYVLTGGDRLRRYKGEGRSYELVNHYGPTESTVLATSGRVGEAGDGVPAIGKAITNTEVYILDERQQAVPIGVSGELCISGDGLARGYIERPDLTAEKFIPNQYSKRAGGRLYRTGDLARYRGDGEIEYLGRKDEQVKIRGYRIELGEIEAALGEQEGIKESVVIAREEGEEKRLVGYVVVEEGEEIGERELRRRLRERLPEYMVPTAIVRLEEMPLTANGKIDRKALPDTEGGREGSRYVEARNEVERELAEIWREVLKVERVGVEDNFFDLGGHSLLATQVISRARLLFNVEISLRSLYEEPTISALGRMIEEHNSTQRHSQAGPILRIPPEQRKELSFAQQRLWFLDQMEPGTSTYNILSGVRLGGGLDIGALERAIREVVTRHEALRTTFSSIDGKPLQVIGAPYPVGLPVIDLSSLDEARSRREAAEVAREEANTGFDLEAGPLLRAKVIKENENRHALLVTMHHIISDGWSMGVLVREVGLLYEAFSRGEESPLKELEIQYADYAMWQREWLSGEVMERELEYWKKHLEGAPAVLEMPADRVRAGTMSRRGGAVDLRLSKEVSDKLRSISRQEGATMYMALLAAYKMMLARYSGKRDIVVGTPVAGRNRVETEGLIGFFVNTLALRTEVEEERSYREMLRRVKEVVLEGQAHQEVPFEKLVEEMSPERSLSYTPLFQVMFSHQNSTGEGAASGSSPIFGLSNAEERPAKFDLNLSVVETAEGVLGSLQYSKDLFDEDRIQRIARLFEKLSGDVAAAPDRRIEEIALLTEEQQKIMLVEWNDTAADYPENDTLHALFEAQAARTPQAIAVESEEGSLSYDEMDKASNQLARYLRKLGVGPEVPVAILCDRSLDMIVGTLGVLKAGGAYVPIDPEYPKARISFMLDDARAPVVLTQGHLAGVLSESRAIIVSLDSDWNDIAQESQESIATHISPDSLAYAIYTSGSTGHPKGVMVTHRAICNHLRWRQSAYELRESDHFIQKASFSFDISVWEIFGTLMSGACLVLARPGGQQDIQYISELIEQKNTRVAHFSVSMLRAFLDEPRALACKSLKRVFCGGELLPGNMKERFFSTFDSELIVQYGPTETSVDVTLYHCARNIDQETPPIGRPIANSQIYILDRHMQPVPVGVPGELYVGGLSLARGYLNRPELTAEKFIPNQFSKEGGGRLYRTGDIARYRADSEIEYLGRIDQQVKIRGYRIELEEIEAAVRQHRSIKDAVVIARERDGSQRLVCYVVEEAGGEGQEEEVTRVALKSYLRERLPEYMVPSVIVKLEEMPLTANGKIDRKALPEVEGGREEGSRYVEARNEVERELVEIWREVLKVEEIGVEDNFFDLGGHSLLATQVISRVRARFQAELRLRDLFANPTIAAMGEMVQESNPELVNEVDRIASILERMELLSSDEIRELMAEESI